MTINNRWAQKKTSSSTLSCLRWKDCRRMSLNGRLISTNGNWYNRPDLNTKCDFKSIRDLHTAITNLSKMRYCSHTCCHRFELQLLPASCQIELLSMSLNWSKLLFLSSPQVGKKDIGFAIEYKRWTPHLLWALFIPTSLLELNVKRGI